MMPFAICKIGKCRYVRTIKVLETRGRLHDSYSVILYNHNMPSLLDLVIRNKSGVVYNDTVEAVSSINDKGIFDILPEHQNFISSIKEHVVIHKKINENQEMKIENGIIRVYRNKVNIYIGI